MDALKTYINNVLMTLPDNEQTKELKQEILKSSQEKYIALLKQGKNENEALGIVIEEFGDIRDLAHELGFEAPDSISEETKRERKEMVQKYAQFRKKFAWMIAGGIALIFVGIILANLFSDADVHSWVPVAGFFIPLALAIGLFVLAGIEDDSYQSYFKEAGMHGFVEDNEVDSQAFHIQSPNNKKINAINTAIGALTVVLYLYLGFFHSLWHPGWVIFIISYAVQSLVKAFFE